MRRGKGARDERGEDGGVVEARARRLRGVCNGEVIADSCDVQVMYETRHQPVYYCPVADVRMDLLEPTDHGST